MHLGITCLAALSSMISTAQPPVATESDPPTTVIPVSSTEDRAAAAGWGTGTWLDQHNAINDIPDQCDVDLVFLGDSITQSWGGCGRTVSSPATSILDEHFATHHPANFGISGDRTQHILWRIDHGNFDGINPSVIVLMIGTNNLAHDAAPHISLGIKTILTRLEGTCPDARILLCGIVRGPDDSHPLRIKASAVNAEIERHTRSRPHVTYVDLPSRFYADDGTADTDLVRGDFVHFTSNGYRAWARMIIDELD